MEQLPFDFGYEERLAKALAEAELALKQVSGEMSDDETKAARRAWLAYGEAWIETYCLSHEFVFSDDLWAAGLDPAGFDSRIVGAAMRRLIKKGTLVESGIAKRRTLGRGAPGTVWRSTTHRGPQ